MSSSMTLSQFLADARVTERAGAPVLGAVAAADREFSGVRYQAPADYIVRELRGDKMRTLAGVYDEFAAALQFPYYFGANKDAFDECLRDLDDFIGRAAGYVLVVRHAEQLLADQPGEREWFVEAMRDSAAYWAKRDTAYRVVQQGDPKALNAVAVTLS
ncbi:barstar family protein [Nocardia sp. CDC159]|uniref:Barstar family protein n=1 Tax=Nocardia pulmonis TaxID=2951408 RepID=A0A9X2J0M6_9NOCA|nr:MULTISPECIES: barstar family protein [Nocardia]MCM6777999.1 barstar family protein [Nocardia pulmonis]MCM6790830.1 barstar family protein [Nocardia sp. CDC159]